MKVNGLKVNYKNHPQSYLACEIFIALYQDHPTLLLNSSVQVYNIRKNILSYYFCVNNKIRNPLKD